MRNSRSAVLATLLLSWGCAVQGATPPIPVHVLAPPVPAIANTGYITAPALVSAGMAGILASVPAQAGAAYLWSVNGGTIPGVSTNAAVYLRRRRRGHRSRCSARSA